MKNDVEQVLEKIEKRMEGCEILSQLLSDKKENREIDYERYTKQGYTDEEVSVGADLVDLYLILKQCSERRQIE